MVRGRGAGGSRTMLLTVLASVPGRTIFNFRKKGNRGHRQVLAVEGVLWETRSEPSRIARSPVRLQSDLSTGS